MPVALGKLVVKVASSASQHEIWNYTPEEFKAVKAFMFSCEPTGIEGGTRYYCSHELLHDFAYQGNVNTDACVSKHCDTDQPDDPSDPDQFEDLAARMDYLLGNFYRA